MLKTESVSRKGFFVMVLAALVALAPLTAWAQPEGGGGEEPVDDVQEAFEALTAEAADLFKAKKYKESADKFIEAYEMKPAPNLLYNIGVVLEKAGEFELAADYYQKFVVAPDIDSNARQDAMRRLKVLQEIISMQKGPEEPKEVKEEKKEPEVVVKEEKKPEVVPPPEPDYTVAYIFLGTGLAALIGGGAMALLASSAHDDFESAATLEDRRSAVDLGETYALTADILFGVGGALALTSIVLFIVESSTGESDPEAMSLSPVFSPEGGGVQLTVPF